MVLKAASTYLVSAKICSGQVTITPFIVTEMAGLNNCDVLIVMYIISLGDFVICNHGGKTLLSFSIPAHATKYNLVERANKINQTKIKKVKFK